MSSTTSDSFSQKTIAGLLFSGWAIALLYLPSGLLHFYLYAAVYGRDVLLGIHLVACLVLLHRAGHLDQLLRSSAILGLVPLFLLPAVFYHDFTLEALRTVKWSVLWLDWIILGYLAFFNRRWDPWLAVFVTITLLELVIEWAVGLYEWHLGEFLFSTQWGEKTALGVLEVSDLRLAGDHIRVRGLQRDVFSFANLMAMSATLGLVWASLSHIARDKILGYLWAAAFAVMLVVSGGRSALFGVFAAALLAGAYAVDEKHARPWSKIYVIFWLGIGVVVSLLGVGTLTETISGLIFGHSHIGDSTSAYMRDDNWRNILAAFENTPLILIIGGPFATLLDSSVAPMFHWADNQYLWDMYHLGVAGFLAIAFYFFRVLKDADRSSPKAMDAMVFFLLLVMGEGIARESLTFMGCAPLFVACGYVNAASQAEGQSRSRSRRREQRHSRRKKERSVTNVSPNA